MSQRPRDSADIVREFLHTVGDMTTDEGVQMLTHTTREQVVDAMRIVVDARRQHIQEQMPATGSRAGNGSSFWKRFTETTASEEMAQELLRGITPVMSAAQSWARDSAVQTVRAVHNARQRERELQERSQEWLRIQFGGQGLGVCGGGSVHNGQDGHGSNEQGDAVNAGTGHEAQVEESQPKEWLDDHAAWLAQLRTSVGQTAVSPKQTATGSEQPTKAPQSTGENNPAPSSTPSTSQRQTGTQHLTAADGQGQPDLTSAVTPRHGAADRITVQAYTPAEIVQLRRAFEQQDWLELRREFEQPGWDETGASSSDTPAGSGQGMPAEEMPWGAMAESVREQRIRENEERWPKMLANEVSQKYRRNEFIPVGGRLPINAERIIPTAQPVRGRGRHVAPSRGEERPITPDEAEAAAARLTGPRDAHYGLTPEQFVTVRTRVSEELIRLSFVWGPSYVESSAEWVLAERLMLAGLIDTNKILE